jgi:arsenate reductase
MQVAVKPTVMFLCTHNAGRSQMAAAWLEHLTAGRVHVFSAGSKPAQHVNSVAVAVMNEVGIDMSLTHPKRWTDAMARKADVVVSMGCGDVCPVYEGKAYLDWEVEDPDGASIERVRAVRDDIEAKIRELLAIIDVEPRAEPRR